MYCQAVSYKTQQATVVLVFFVIFNFIRYFLKVDFLKNIYLSSKMDISPKKRTKIVTLSEHTSMTQRDIAKECCVSLGAVNKILKKKRETGTIEVNRKGKCGRKRKTTARDEVFLIRESRLNPRKTSQELQQDLAHAGVVVHDSTVRKRLIEGGRKTIRPQKKQLLTAAMMKKRYDWAKLYKGWTVEDWRKVLFSDESHFLVQGQRSRFVRKSENEKLTTQHFDQTVKHPIKKMFWGCFSYKGTGSLVPIEGMMNSEKYKNLLEQKLENELRKLDANGQALFQQDSAPCHVSKVMRQYFTEKKIRCLEWPGNSPDLNPIENLWAILKARLRKIDCTTKTKLIEAVIQLWFRDTQISENCKKLVDSMPNRVKQIIKNKGGHIAY